jgi:two-component system, LuxR family, response regulator FixJ
MVAGCCDGSEKGCVIIVEDDAAVCKALAFAFGTHDIRVRCYGSAEDLLADGTPADACHLILDYKLPNMNGLELLRELKKRGLHAPAVIIATSPPAAIRAAAAAAGATLVEKPLLGEELYDLVIHSRQRPRAPPHKG